MSHLVDFHSSVKWTAGAEDADIAVFRFTLGIPGFNDALLPRVVGIFGAALLVANHLSNQGAAPAAQAGLYLNQPPIVQSRKDFGCKIGLGPYPVQADTQHEEAIKAWLHSNECNGCRCAQSVWVLSCQHSA